MSSNVARFSVHSSRILVRAVLLLVPVLGSSLAQQQNPPPVPSPGSTSRAEFEKHRVNKREMDARETDIRLAEKGAKEVDGNKESLTMKRVSENFVRLQTVTNEIMGAVKNDLTLEYLRVRDAAAEINKCAQRLKSDLVFPEAKGKRAKRDDSDDTDVKASLLQLNLDQIIELSNSIRKHSDKLSKTSLKP